MRSARFAVRHPVYITMILIALILFGLLSLGSMNIEFISGLNMPQVIVYAIYPGASAEEVENDVIDILEENFATLPDFKSMTSSAYSSVAVVNIQFADGVDAYDQLDEVRNRINDLSDSLPAGLEGDPVAIVGGTEMLPVFSFTIEGGNDIAATTAYANDTLLPLLTRIAGVSSVSISGGSEPEVLITLDTDRLAAMGISPLQVYQILGYSNTNLPLDMTVYQGRNTSLRFDGEYESLDDIRNLTVGATGEGSLIRLSDVASVSLTTPEPETVIKNDGKNIVMVEITKRADGNTMQIASEVKTILARQEAATGGALHFNVIADDSRTISASLEAVIQSGIMGVIVAVLVIFLILGNIQATLTIALSMPLSIFFTFIAMKVSGVTISLMSITGMVVALGAIVDGSIVMLEQIYKHWQTRKDGRFLYTVSQSIFKGSDEVGVSILGSAITTVIVFVPVLFVQGMGGMIMRDVALTFMFALSASCIVAIVFIPYFLKKFLKEDSRKITDNRITRTMDAVTLRYGQAVSWVLKNRKFVIAISIVLLVLTVWAVIQLGVAFIPSTDNSEFYVNFTFPSGNTNEETEASLDEAEQIVREVIPEVRTIVTSVGVSSGLSFSSSSSAGSIRVLLPPVAEREKGRDVHTLMTLVKSELDERMSDCEVEVLNGGFDNLVSYVTGGGGYSLTLVGEDINTLYSEAERIRNRLMNDPEVLSVSMDSSFDSYSAVIDASNDLLSSAGLTSYEAGTTTAILFNGMDCGIYTDPATGERYDIRLESNVMHEDFDESTLANLTVMNQAGGSVSYASIAQLAVENTISQINHTDKSNTISISAAITSEDYSRIQERLNEYLEMYPLADGISRQASGVTSLIEDTLVPIIGAMLIGFFLVFMVMVFQFERFDQPVIVMLTIPFCFIGVAISLIAAGSTLNMLSLLGVITLGGTAVNNGIILFDYTNMTIKRKRIAAISEKYDETPDEDTIITGRLDYSTERDILSSSITESAMNRLKSILMTTLTTMMGVVPMAVATGEGSEIYACLGQAIAGGLFATTVISLFVLPVIYYTLERWKLRKTYSKNRKEARSMEVAK